MNYQIELNNKLLEIKNRYNRHIYIEKKTEYKLKKNIFDLLQISGIGIFGGSIRDQILHENGSKKFYQFYEKYTNDLTINLPNFKTYHIDYDRIILAKPINETYCDSNFHINTYIDRNTILNDIDCVMAEGKIEKLVQDILNLDKSISIKTVNYKNFKNYIILKDPSNIISSYTSIYITCNNKYNNIKNIISNSQCIDANIDIPIFNSIKFKLDIFLYNENNNNIFQALNIMSSNSDYFCNSLYLINNRISVNDNITKIFLKSNYDSIEKSEIKNIDIFLKKHIYKQKMVNMIINQISNRLAYEVKCNIVYKRKLKMLDKKFKIFEIFNFFEEICINNEICILCQDNITDSRENIKLICCNSSYHKNCFKDIVNRHKYEIKPCYMCSNMINFNYIFRNYFS